MILDIFCHWLPQAYFDAARRHAATLPHMLVRARALPVMVNVEARLALMDQFPDYRQVISLAFPPVEDIAGPEATPELARIANDEMASLVTKYSDRFPAFVASLPMNNSEAALAEAERAIKVLGACGVQIFTNVNGRPLDEPEFMALFELMAELDRPIWLHPARGMDFPDYLTENVSKFELWCVLGWPYETSAAMARLVFAGVFDRWPHLKIITHHTGGMVPMVEGRLGPQLDVLGTRTPPGQEDVVRTPLKERPLNAFRRFYADTASFGSRATIECGLYFFGIERLLFASDMPFGAEQGAGNIRDTLKAIQEMNLSPEERAQILAGNAQRLLQLSG